MLAFATAAPALAVSASPTPSPSPSVSPTPTTQVQLPSLPSLDPQKLIYQTIAGILYSMGRLLMTEMEKLWNPMVTGTDDLNGSTNFGQALVVDNSHLHSMWAISLGIASGSLLVLLFTLSVVLWMLRSAVGVRHDLIRNLVYFFATVILMAGSFFLITQVIHIDKTLVLALNNPVTF